MSRPSLRLFTISVCLLGIAAFFFSSANHNAVRASSTTARQRGADLFETAGCMRCHSITGVGGVRAPDLGNVALRRDARRIKDQIMKGGHGMPPFGKVLKKDQVNDLVQFLTSCETKRAPGCRKWMPPLPQSPSVDQ